VNMDYRYELKFVLNNSELADAMQWLYQYTHAREKYKKRKVNSLYLDDVDFTSVRDNLSGVSDRKKIRLRWYGSGDNTSPVFEVKVRDGRLGYKKSYPINSLENRLLKLDIKDIIYECESELRMQGVIIAEPLVPTLQVSFDREYFEDLNGIRITLDQKIQFFSSLPQQKLNNSIPAQYPYNVMEIKFEPHMKTQIAELIKPLHLVAKRHSKYLVGLATLGYVVYT
jgi:SPX domain protein involved in polyphosphate accumulation